MTTFASDKHAWGECARCGARMLLKHMLNDGYYPNLIVCPSCWEPRHPQESLPNVEDPVVLYRPSPENLPAAGPLDLTAEGGGGGETGVMYVLARNSPNTWQVSDDGDSWRDMADSPIFQAHRVYHFRNLQRWFATGFGGVIMSDDGESWVNSLILEDNFFQIAYAPILGANHIGRLVVNSGSGLFYSDDGGNSWTPCSYVGGFTFDSGNGIAWDQEIEKFVANGIVNSAIAAQVNSNDGVTFDSLGITSGFDFEDAASNAGRIVLARTDVNVTLVTTDGIETEAITGFPPGNFGTLNGVDYGFGIFLLPIQVFSGGNQNAVDRTADGFSGFTTTTLGFSATLGALQEVRPDVTRDRWWYVSANRLHRSNDNQGTAWTQILASTQLRAIGVRDLIEP